MKLVEAREKAGRITIRELAEKSGVSPTTIWKAENGTRKPQYPTIVKLSRALRVKPKDIDEFAEVLAQAEAARMPPGQEAPRTLGTGAAAGQSVPLGAPPGTHEAEEAQEGEFLEFDYSEEPGTLQEELAGLVETAIANRTPYDPDKTDIWHDPELAQNPFVRRAILAELMLWMGRGETDRVYPGVFGRAPLPPKTSRPAAQEAPHDSEPRSEGK